MKSAARTGAGTALASLLVHYPDANLDKITSRDPLDAAVNVVDPMGLLPQVRPAASRVMKYADLWEHVEATPGEESSEEE